MFTAFAAGDAVDFPPEPPAASDDDESSEYGYHSEGSTEDVQGGNPESTPGHGDDSGKESHSGVSKDVEMQQFVAGLNHHAPGLITAFRFDK